MHYGYQNVVLGSIGKEFYPVITTLLRWNLGNSGRPPRPPQDFRPHQLKLMELLLLLCFVHYQLAHFPFSKLDYILLYTSPNQNYYFLQLFFSPKPPALSSAPYHHILQEYWSGGDVELQIFNISLRKD